MNDIALGGFWDINPHLLWDIVGPDTEGSEMEMDGLSDEGDLTDLGFSMHFANNNVSGLLPQEPAVHLPDAPRDDSFSVFDVPNNVVDAGCHGEPGIMLEPAREAYNSMPQKQYPMLSCIFFVVRLWPGTGNRFKLFVSEDASAHVYQTWSPRFKEKESKEKKLAGRVPKLPVKGCSAIKGGDLVLFRLQCNVASHVATLRFQIRDEVGRIMQTEPVTFRAKFRNKWLEELHTGCMRRCEKVQEIANHHFQVFQQLKNAMVGLGELNITNRYMVRENLSNIKERVEAGEHRKRKHPGSVSGSVDSSSSKKSRSNSFSSFKSEAEESGIESAIMAPMALPYPKVNVGNTWTDPMTLSGHLRQVLGPYIRKEANLPFDAQQVLHEVLRACSSVSSSQSSSSNDSITKF